MRTRRSKRQNKPTAQAAAKTEHVNPNSKGGDKENCRGPHPNVATAKRKPKNPEALKPTREEDADEITPVYSTRKSAAATERSEIPDEDGDADEITPVYATRNSAKATKAQSSDMRAPLLDVEDIVPPAQDTSATRLKEGEEAKCKMDEIDEISRVHQDAPPSTARQSNEPPHPLTLSTRPSLGVLQSHEPPSFRPKKVTYGKRRRVHPVEMPTSHSLGVRCHVSPEKTGDHSTGSPPRQPSDEDEEESSEDDVSSPGESLKGLRQFMEEQRALWAEVDAVDLEEQMD